MDDELRARIEETAEIAALYNALKHDSDAQVNAIMGPLMGENPEFREYGDEIPSIIMPVINRVNELAAEKQAARLQELAPDQYAEVTAENDTEDEWPLPELPNVEDTVRMRMAPNPNGPWHLGHARMPSVIGTYKELYDGWMLCRFDDTDPETKRPDIDAYDAILDAIEYLGFEPDAVVRASDRLETYYEHATNLIDLDGAYTCSCEAETFSEAKNAGEACEHRSKSPATVHEEFAGMIEGDYAAGEMVLRVKTDITHPNPALRDYVAFRIIDTPHPRSSAASYRCWPMLDFQSGIDDYEFDITHIIRGIDLQDSAKRQQFIYEYFDWTYPEVIHWGHVQIDAYDIAMSTSTIKAAIEEETLDGWDDPRAPTIASVKRRGIRGEAIVNAMIELGTSTSDVDLSMSTIYANNRAIIDTETDRAFFVRDGVSLPIIGAPDKGTPPLHPDDPDRGTRSLPIDEAVLLEPDDVPSNGKRVWLKGLGPVRHTRNALEFTADDIDIVREEDVDVIHWVPAETNIQLTLRTLDDDFVGHAEPGLQTYEQDDMIQFERVGFARIDSVTSANVVAYYAHP